MNTEARTLGSSRTSHALLGMMRTRQMPCRLPGLAFLSSGRVLAVPAGDVCCGSGQRHISSITALGRAASRRAAGRQPYRSYCHKEKQQQGVARPKRAPPLAISPRRKMKGGPPDFGVGGHQSNNHNQGGYVYGECTVGCHSAHLRERLTALREHSRGNAPAESMGSPQGEDPVHRRWGG